MAVNAVVDRHIGGTDHFREPPDLHSHRMTLALRRPMVRITERSPLSITEIPQAMRGMAGLR